MLFIPPFNVLSSDFYVSLSLVVAATVSLIKNFAKVRDMGSLCVIPSVSIFASGYITEVDIIIFVCILFFLFFRLCVFEGHNLFSSDETCNQSPLMRYLLNTLYKDQRNVLVNFDSSGLEMLLNCNCMCTVILGK